MKCGVLRIAVQLKGASFLTLPTSLVILISTTFSNALFSGGAFGEQRSFLLCGPIFENAVNYLRLSSVPQSLTVLNL